MRQTSALSNGSAAKILKSSFQLSAFSFFSASPNLLLQHDEAES
jgi:hypothetical protein